MTNFRPSCRGLAKGAYGHASVPLSPLPSRSREARLRAITLLEMPLSLAYADVQNSTVPLWAYLAAERSDADALLQPLQAQESDLVSVGDGGGTCQGTVSAVVPFVWACTLQEGSSLLVICATNMDVRAVDASTRFRERCVFSIWTRHAIRAPTWRCNDCCLQSD